MSCCFYQDELICCNYNIFVFIEITVLKRICQIHYKSIHDKFKAYLLLVSTYNSQLINGRPILYTWQVLYGVGQYSHS